MVRIRILRSVLLAPYLLLVSGAAAQLHSHDLFHRPADGVSCTGHHSEGDHSDPPSESTCLLCYHLTTGAAATIPIPIAVAGAAIVETSVLAEFLSLYAQEAFSLHSARAPPLV